MRLSSRPIATGQAFQVGGAVIETVIKMSCFHSVCTAEQDQWISVFFALFKELQRFRKWNLYDIAPSKIPHAISHFKLNVF